MIDAGQVGLLPKTNRGVNMENQSINDIHERLILLMNRRKANKALKFITTNHQKYSMEYEVTGDL